MSAKFELFMVPGSNIVTIDVNGNEARYPDVVIASLIATLFGALTEAVAEHKGDNAVYLRVMLRQVTAAMHVVHVEPSKRTPEQKRQLEKGLLAFAKYFNYLEYFHP